MVPEYEVRKPTRKVACEVFQVPECCVGLGSVAYWRKPEHAGARFAGFGSRSRVAYRSMLERTGVHSVCACSGHTMCLLKAHVGSCTCNVVCVNPYLAVMASPIVAFLDNTCDIITCEQPVGLHNDNCAGTLTECICGRVTRTPHHKVELWDWPWLFSAHGWRCCTVTSHGVWVHHGHGVWVHHV